MTGRAPIGAATLVAHLRERVLDFIFPKRCVGCAAWDTFLCPECAATTVRLLPPFCFACGDTISAAEAVSGLCANCRQRPPAFLDGARSAFRFSGAIREAIHALKYDGVTALAPMLASEIVPTLSATGWHIDRILPVPLHPSRRRERGYNQAEELARVVAAALHIEVDTTSLQRTRATPTQTLLDRDGRRENVRGAFAWHGDALLNARVLLIDDVMTTGATLDACAAVLKAAGAAAVYAATVARG